MVLPRLHRVVLSLFAGSAATVSCMLVGAATNDLVQCLWALAAGVSMSVAVVAWWPLSQTVAPRPPSAVPVHAKVETDVESGVDMSRAA